MSHDISLRERIRLNLISAMDSAGISQVQLAKKLGISKGTVNNWIRGNNSPDVDIVPDICTVLGITIISLFSSGETAILDTKQVSLSSKEIELALAYRRASDDDRIAVEAVLRKYRDEKEETLPQNEEALNIG